LHRAAVWASPDDDRKARIQIDDGSHRLGRPVPRDRLDPPSSRLRGRCHLDLGDLWAAPSGENR
jgi:hypothetical protein